MRKDRDYYFLKGLGQPGFGMKSPKEVRDEHSDRIHDLRSKIRQSLKKVPFGPSLDLAVSQEFRPKSRNPETTKAQSCKTELLLPKIQDDRELLKRRVLKDIKQTRIGKLLQSEMEKQ